MPVIKYNDQQYTLNPGPTRLGGGGQTEVNLGDDALGEQAIIDLGKDGKAVIRRASDQASVKVNGVALGVEPTPLLHGDKVDIAGHEIRFSEDTKGGATQFVSAADVAAFAQKRSGQARATTATGGRLVSLVDGKEYTVPATGITFGRDASSAIVVAQTEVSRLHAEILPADNGYVIHDRSTNGLLVNGTRVEKSQLLSRSDVIRIGTEEFRFYADVAPAKPTPGVSMPAAPAAPVVTPPPAPSLSAAMPELELLPAAPRPQTPPKPAPPAAPAAPPVTPSPVKAAVAMSPADDTTAAKPVDTRPILAVFEVVNEGPTRGTKFYVRSPLTHIGRGAHNDIVINDESISETHAKIQHRDDGWYLVDAESTNGSYIGGVRFVGERKIDGAPDVRFGSVKTVFRPTDQTIPEGKGTRAIASIDRVTQQQLRATAVAPPPAPEAKGKLPAWIWIVVAAAVIGGIAFFAMPKG